MSDIRARASADHDGRQVIEIRVHAGYDPATILARAGAPLRIVFHRDDDDHCTERVVFSAPRLERRLSAGTTIVDLPARTPGEVRFTCGMGRYRGRIEFLDEAPGRTRSRSDPVAWLVDARIPRAVGLTFALALLLLALGIQPLGAGIIAVAVLAAALGTSLRSTRARRSTGPL